MFRGNLYGCTDCGVVHVNFEQGRKPPEVCSQCGCEEFERVKLNQ